MIVCVCRRVSDREIEHHARTGCDSFGELQMELGVGTCCGRCADCAKEVFEGALQCGTPHGKSVHHPAVGMSLMAA